MKIKIKLLYNIIIILFLSSCVAVNRGKILDKEEISKIDIGLTNRENVVNLIGFPSFKSNFDKDKWVYYAYKTRKILFLKPTLIEQEVLILEFDGESDIVKNMFLYTINSNEYKLYDNSTSLDVNDSNVIKDILNNIGNFSIK
jgi:outer membrane protein assembly factor BamE (lipoprotein component of BamABCDE complex)